MNIREIAKLKGDGYKQEHDKINIHTCPFCNDKSYQLIFRETSRTFVCKSCNTFGTAEELAIKFKVDCIDEPTIPSVKFCIDDVKNKIDIVEVSPDVSRYFAAYRITDETLEATGIFSTSGFESSVNFIAVDMKNNVKAVKVVTLKGDDISVEVKSDTLNYLTGIDKVLGDDIVITSSDIARLALIQNNINNVVSIVSGSNMNWIEECFEFLESKKKILLLLDKSYSNQYLDEIILRLGKFKVHMIDHDYNNVIDIHLNNDQKVLDDIRGYKYNIEVENLLSFDSIDISDVAKPIDLKDKIINAMLAGGYEGELTIYSGLPGAGKTTLLNQMCCGIADAGKDSIMIYSGEFKTSTLKQKLQETAAGRENLDLIQNRYDPKLIERKVKDKSISDAIDEHFGDRINIYNYDIIAKADELLKTIEVAYKKKGTKVFVLDNLMTIWLDGSENEKLEKQTQFVMKLKALTKNYPIHIFLVAHPKKIEDPKKVTMHDIAGTSNIANLADNIIFIRRLDDKELENILKNNGKIGIPPSIEIKLLKDRHYGRIDYKKYMAYDRDTGRVHSVQESPDWLYKWEVIYNAKKNTISA